MARDCKCIFGGKPTGPATRDNRGRVLTLLMTNRPDKLDIDIKRAGRLDRKIPFFYASAPLEVEAVIQALLGRYGIAVQIEFPRDRTALSEPLVGLSKSK